METKENDFVPFDQREFFGLRVEQWKVVVKKAIEAGAVSYGALRANEKLKERQ